MKISILYKIFLIGVCVAFFGNVNDVIAQNTGNTVSGTIVDGEGNPVEGVQIDASFGVSAITDADGTFTFEVPVGTSVIIRKDGYSSRFLDISDLDSPIVLEQSQFLASPQDEVNFGIISKNKREIVGAASTITPSDRMTFDNTQWVRDYISGLLLGVRGSSNIRGLGNAIFVIDGVIGRNPDILNMDEIDQITVLRDANSVALYGNEARNGVIVINTKRGQPNQKSAKVNIRYGMKDPISLPKYLGSADYMELFNEARFNDGFQDAFFDADAIENHRSGTNPYRYPDVDIYSDEYLRSMGQTANILSEFSGGNDKTQYYVNLGWNFDQSMVSLNPAANVGSNRFNVRGNIDFTVNSWIKSNIDIVAITSSTKSALTNLLNVGATLKPNAYAPLLPVSMMDTAANPTLAGQVSAAGIYGGMLLGGSQVYGENAPIADVMAGGYRNSIFRSTQFNNGIDFDLDMITEGLTAKTYLSFDFYDAYNTSINNRFRTYEPEWDGDKIIALTPYGEVDQKDLTENVSTNNFINRLGFYGLINYDKTINENHHINTTFLGFVNSTGQNNQIQANKNSHLGLQVSYDFKRKLFVDFTGTYIHSIKLPEGNRGGISPTGGVAYVLSEEDFMKGIDFLNFLKLKATAGIIKSDLGIGGYYLYDETYSDGAWYNWNDGAFSNREKDISQGGNDLMTFEDRIDLNIGFESYLFNSLWLEFNYFKSDLDKQLTTIDNIYPSFYNVFKPFNNFNRDSYTGFEVGLEYAKKFNDLSLNIGGNLMYAQSEVVKRDEVYENDYEFRTGRPVNAIYGHTDDGFYSESDFSIDQDGNYVLNESLPVPAYGAVQPGDIKYIDKNNDGVVNDNDRSFIGEWANPLSFGTNVKLSYKGFSLYVLGIGQFAGQGMMSDQNNESYFWIDGNDKYSELVEDRWTPETANVATYPRLSSQANNNNYRNSTFWMYANDFFDIERAQITYEFTSSFCDKLRMKNLSVNVTGVNLVRFSENKDIQQLNTIGNPQFRYFTLGLRSTF